MKACKGSFLKQCLKEIEKMIQSPGLWLSIGLGLVLVFSMTVYEDETGNAYNSISILMEYSKEEISIHTNIEAEKVFSNVIKYMYSLYGTMIVALAVAGPICQENKSNARRYLIFRSGKWKYCLSKTVSTMVVSAAVLVIIGIIYMIYCRVFFPNIIDTPVENWSYWFEYQMTTKAGTKRWLFELLGIEAYYIYQLMGLAFYGVFCGAIAFFVLSVTSNIYVAVCIPFFIGYMHYSICDTITARFYEGDVRQELYMAVLGYGHPNGYTYFWKMEDYLDVNTAIVVILWICAIGAHMIQIKRMKDCGVK